MVFDDSTPLFGTAVTTTFYTTATQFASIDPYKLVVRNTTSGAQTSYEYLHVLEKDYTVAHSGDFSWKSTLKARILNLLDGLRPLGSVPLKANTNVTFSIALHRSGTTNTYVALVVFPHGANGFAVADDFKELVAYVTAGANTWQTVSVSFDVKRAESVDVYLAHYGAANSIARFDTLRVIEL
jgi:hypothetical protein